MTDFSIDTFDYENAFDVSGSLYVALLVILVAGYLVMIPAILYLLQNGKKGMAIGLFILMILPFGVTQVVGLLLSGILIIYYARTQKIRKFMNRSVFVLGTLVYAVASYITILVVLFFGGNSNLYEIQNQQLYRKTNVTLNEMVQYGFVAKSQRKKIEKEITLGKKNVMDKRIVIGLLTKNGIKHIAKVKKKLDLFVQYFADYRVLIFENDSTDNTREILNEWSQIDPKVILLDCSKLGSEDCKLNMQDPKSGGYTSFSRSEKMAFLRQQILNEVQSTYSLWDYFCIFDFDLSGAFFIDGFLTTFAKSNWDMVFGNGLTFTPLPFLHAKPFVYDCFAFVGEHQNYQSSSEISHFFSCNKILEKYIRKMKWCPSRSGFNGIAIYKIASLKNASYTPQKNLRCEHVFLHVSMAQNGHDKIYFNPSMILFPGQQCEHRFQMFLNTIKNLFKK